MRCSVSGMRLSLLGTDAGTLRAPTMCPLSLIDCTSSLRVLASLRLLSACRHNSHSTFWLRNLSVAEYAFLRLA
eukprot:12930202-Prorocentrum_lima.AAC.1